MPTEPHETCPQCGARIEPHQQYCLECGERLPHEPGIAASLWKRVPETWLVPAALFLVVTSVATAASVAAAPSSSHPAPSTVIATQPVTVGTGTLTTSGTHPATTARTTQTPTLTTGTLPSPPGETGSSTAPPPATTATVPAAPAGLTAWPAQRSGWTDVLESLPVSAGRDAALARAHAAARAGLRQAGVLLSSDFSSLHSGYYVVFSGIYAGSAQATSALALAHSRGFPDAYSTRVSP